MRTNLPGVIVWIKYQIIWMITDPQFSYLIHYL